MAWLASQRILLLHRVQASEATSQPAAATTDRQARSIALAGGRPGHRSLRAMEEQLGPVAVTHLLQHTLRSLCTGADAPQWVYAVFWRILPRNYPPPKCVSSLLARSLARLSSPSC